MRGAASPWDLERLLWKYRMLAGLRARREALEAAGATGFDAAEGLERKRLFRRIAREFPGALRELDTLPAARLEARAARVEDELGWRAAPGEWTAIVLDFHQTLREALMVKRWIARRIPRGGVIPQAVVEDFTQRLDRMHRLRVVRAGGSHGGGRRRDEHAELLARHLRPPGGRVLALVWATLEQRHGKPRAELEEMIFGGANG